MIYTVTLNPSIDYIVFSDIHLGELNRSKKEMKNPGGKGINVSRVLKQLGVNTTATGFLGGFTGEFIKQKLQEEQIKTDFIEIQEDTRINIKLKGIQETEINGSSPFIERSKHEELVSKISKVSEQDIIVLGGSVPASLPLNIYQTISQKGKERKAKIVLDASGEAFIHGLEEQPFLIKPNHHELGELFGVTISSVKEAIPFGKTLLDKGIENIIVSFASKGALFMSQTSCYIANVPRGIVRNSVGAGDSVVAGFLETYTKTKDVKEAFRNGVAAGSASAFSEGFCTKEEIEKLKKEIEIVSR
ncbi:1-phosphofructokinase [Alkalihalobacterium bogoriense]|uniref:1-phosphofructokinase n=1 Tax=Alkalihalobacterium bogoriense TaxID=246272 RepID=UPI000479DD76|nr:1-phosphofructokinase [Alkalihalobacterium bogoriense]